MLWKPNLYYLCFTSSHTAECHVCCMYHEVYILNRLALINPNEIIRDTWHDWIYYDKWFNIKLRDTYDTYDTNFGTKPTLTLFSLWILLRSGNMKNWPADPVGPVQSIFFPIVHNFKLSVPIVQLAGPTGGSGPQSLCVSVFKKQKAHIGY